MYPTVSVACARRQSGSNHIREYVLGVPSATQIHKNV